jgi:glucose/arabinose dehydrogenase
MPRSRSLLVLAAALAVTAGLVPAASSSAAALPERVPALAVPGALTPVAHLRVTALRVASGLVNPVLVRSANDGTSRLFVVEQAGRIRTVVGSTVTGTYLDLSSIVTSGGERGLLGLAFPKDFATSHLLWVSYTRSDGALVVARFQARSATSPSVLLSTRRTVIVIPHPVNANHNGGNIDFGADGYLYLGTGDGGSAGDPHNNAQSLRSLLGKMLRVNVRCATGPAYCIPPTNPYATSRKARREIWMSGLRNPWRWSFDTNGTQWIGDVGQGKYEEIDAISATSAKRRNLGWSCREGKHVYNASRCRSTTAYTAPVLELCHPDSVSGCTSGRAAEAIIGGYVYRGATYPSAVGTYVFGDYVTGKIWAYRSGLLGVPTALVGVSGFGVQDNREIYAVTLGGGLYRIGFRTV